MTYVFQGILTRQILDQEAVEDSFLIKTINVSGLRSAIRFPKEEEIEEPLDFIKKLPLIEEALYIFYECWGGELGFIEGYRVKGENIVSGTEFHCDNGAEAEGIFVRVMRSFGVSIQDDGHFEPFTRDYGLG